MLARNASLAGVIFIGLLFALMIALGGPLEKLVRKIVKSNDKCILVCELCIIALMALGLTKWIAPLAENLFRQFLRYLHEIVLNMLG